MRRKTRGECFLVTLAGLGCLMVVAALLVGGGYFYYRNGQTPAPAPVEQTTQEPATSQPLLRLEETVLGEDQLVVERRFPKMVLTEAQTVPFIQKGFAHGEDGKTEPCEIYFLKQKVHEIRFAATLEVNGQKFLARDKPTLAALSQALGVQGTEGRLTQLPPTFWFFEWEKQKLSVVLLDSGYYFSLDGQ